MDVTADAGMSAGDALAEVDRLLDSIDLGHLEVDHPTRLEWVRLARLVQRRLEALTSILVAEADKSDSSLRVTGTPTISWLGMQERLSGREAARVVHQARALHTRPLVSGAAVAGQLGSSQARAITRVLESLAPQLDNDQQVQAEQLLVEWADQLDADQLARSAEQVLERVTPVDAESGLEELLVRQAELSHRQRSLRFFQDGASVRFSGSLPKVDAQQWIVLLDAHAEAQRRTALEARDPLAEVANAEQRRADALVAMVRAAHATGVRGAGSAQILVKLDYDKLQNAAAGAGIIEDGQALSAGELRRLCCDAELIPAVLDGASQVLDVGRAARLVTQAIRIALIARDEGCAFPGCDTRPGFCEAHHIQPWSAGGTTSLSNLVLLCHRHHDLLEPARADDGDHWQVRIAQDGLPEFVPPGRVDQGRCPVRHRRRGGNRAPTWNAVPAPSSPSEGCVPVI